MRSRQTELRDRYLRKLRANDARWGACLGNDRRSEDDPQRAAFCDRFPRIVDAM
jgi:hypothetical protein